MPGLFTLRPGFGSASKVAKSATSKHAVSAARTEKGRDERSLVMQGGKGSAPAALARREGYRAPSLSPAPPYHRPQMPGAAQPAKPKQVSGLLGHIVNAQAHCNGLDISKRMGCTSTTEHEINSVCLAKLVHEFLEDETEGCKCGRARCNCESGTVEDSSLSIDGDEKSSLGGELVETLQGFIPSASLSERAILASVTSAIQEWNEQQADATSDKRAGCSLLRRHVMVSLRASGYNAAICKSRWEHVGGFPGGDYEYIHVVLEALGGSTERIVVDIDFRTQFEIARPTPQYAALLQTLPSVYVGKADRLQQIVNILCDAAKQSLKKKGMPLPPWRKPEYIRAKWFTSYRHTIDEFPESFSTESKVGLIGGAGWTSKITTVREVTFPKASD